MLKFTGISRKWEPGTTVLYLRKLGTWHAEIVTSSQTLKDIFVNVLSVEPKKVSFIINRCVPLNEKSKQQVMTNLFICKKINLFQDRKVSSVKLFDMPPSTFEIRGLLLKELGVTDIEPLHMYRFAHCMKLPMSSFKKLANIPTSVNVCENLLSYLHKAPPEVPPLQQPDDNATVMDHYLHCIQYYLHWKFDLSESEVQKYFKISTLFRYRSFNHMRAVVDLLIDEFHFSIEDIRKCVFLLGCHPEKLKYMLTEMERLTSIDIRTMFKNYPRVPVLRTEAVPKIFQILKSYDIPDSVIIKHPEVFLIPPSTLDLRLKYVFNSPKLCILRNNPKLLRLIYLYDTVMIRLKYLEHLNMDYTSISLLISSNTTFSRAVSTKGYKLTMEELTYYLTLEFEFDITYVQTKLRKHPFWRYTSIPQIKETVLYLKERFSPIDISKCVYIILYPREKVENALNVVERYDSTYGIASFTPSQVLSLCVYILERDHHFSGDGIWRINTKSNEITLDESFADLRTLDPSYNSFEGAI
ncbi:transcription termination factor 5, mitochondrial [Orussus abietinus]|uniref:transcription termination factor 5, mitochondrial n=1 Tax=Orussus abietinus TaxID=222816 RepID=UPI0006261EA9|nr:transcription termination factor 5, mitochondrial [Orussus abietinus]